MKIFLIFNFSRKHKILHVFGHTFIFRRYFTCLCKWLINILWHGKCQSKCKKGWCSIVQSVKTLFTNKDVTAADICLAFLMDIIDSKSKNNNLGFTIVVNFTFYCLTFDNLIYCLRVFIKLTEIKFTWNRNATLNIFIPLKRKV